MQLLVTGYKGFIGSHMVNMLKQHNHIVTTYEWGEDDYSLDGIDWVIHIGAVSSTTESDIEKIMLQNYDFSVRLLERCIHKKVNLQYSSSASIYGLKKEFKEDSPVDPRTPYAWSKYMFERYVKHKELEIVDRCIVQGFRYFNVYGSNEEHKGSQASPFTQFRLQAEKHGVIKVFENSEKYHRDFIPVEQVCKIHMDFLKINKNGIFNIGTGKTMSFLDIAKTFNVPIEEIPMPQSLKHSYQEYTCADMTKTQTTLTHKEN